MAAEETADASTPRRSGRPRPATTGNGVTGESAAKPAKSGPTGRPRGRPRIDRPPKVPSGRPRGRPKMRPEDRKTPVKPPGSTGRGRGRPRKITTGDGVTKAAAPMAKAASGRGRGRPAKSANSATPAKTTPGRRGRPAKGTPAKEEDAEEKDETEVAAVASGEKDDGAGAVQVDDTAKDEGSDEVEDAAAATREREPTEDGQWMSKIKDIFR